MTARVVTMLAAAALAACGSKGEPGEAEGANPRGARDPMLDVALPTGATRIEGNQFHVDVAALPGCTAGADCTAIAELSAHGSFKVNLEYPYKFVPEAGAAITPASTFAPVGVKTGRLVLRFRRPSAEPVRVAGTFKLSVCNPEQCLIETAALAVAIP